LEQIHKGGLQIKTRFIWYSKVKQGEIESAKGACLTLRAGHSVAGNYEAPALFKKTGQRTLLSVDMIQNPGHEQGWAKIRQLNGLTSSQSNVT
jgi:hypothetical protein